MASTNTTTELTLLQVNPAELGIRDQAREDASPDEQLIASIRAHGIIQPPVVELDDTDGQYKIVTGHRRVGAAIAAGLTAITVIVRPHGDAPITLEQQIVENERRKQLTAKDLANGYERLTLFGLRPEDIAAGVGEKPERIRAGLKINASETAAHLVETTPAIDFEQAATIAEFDEHPKLQKRLVETATTRPENFARDVENVRAEARVAARVEEVKNALAADGVQVADVQSYEGGSWWTGKGVGTGSGRTLERLGIRPEEHLDCPGHAAVIHRASSYYLDKDGFDFFYVCTDWEGNGHAQAEPEKSPEQLEREAEWQRAQEERNARQALVDANTRARRAWLHGHLTTGRLRPTAHHFDLLADAVLTEAVYQDGTPYAVLRELLDGEPHKPDSWNDSTNADTVAELIQSRQAPSLRVAIAAAIARHEYNPDGLAAVGYWAALTNLGYQLTDTDKEHQTAAAAALADWQAEQAGEAMGGPEGDEDVDGGEDE